MSTFNRILSDIVDIIRIESKSDQKYENKCDISDIRSYLIRFHPWTEVKMKPKTKAKEIPWPCLVL